MLNNTTEVLDEIVDILPTLSNNIDVMVGWTLVGGFVIVFFILLTYLTRFLK